MATRMQPAVPALGAPPRALPASAVDVRVPGFLCVVMAAQFMTVLMLAASMAPNYDLHGGAISDLGAIPETALLFNVSLLTVGVLNVAAAVLWYRWHRRGWLLAISAIAGIGAVGAAAFPLGSSGLHGLFALVAFLAFNLQAIGSSVESPPAIRPLSLAAGVVGLGFVVLMVIGDSGHPGVFGPIGHGGAERMIVYPVMLWLMAFGGALLAGPPNRTAT